MFNIKHQIIEIYKENQTPHLRRNIVLQKNGLTAGNI